MFLYFKNLQYFKAAMVGAGSILRDPAAAAGQQLLMVDPNLLQTWPSPIHPFKS